MGTSTLKVGDAVGFKTGETRAMRGGDRAWENHDGSQIATVVYEKRCHTGEAADAHLAERTD